MALLDEPAGSPTPFVHVVASVAAATGFLAFAALVLWADGAPPVIRAIGRGVSAAVRTAEVDAAHRILVAGVHWIERRSGIDVQLASYAQFPRLTDGLGHAVLWGFGTVLFGALGTRLVRPHRIAIVLVGISLLFEVLQPSFSGRTIERSDLVSNTVGIAVGALLLTLIVHANRRADPRRPRR